MSIKESLTAVAEAIRTKTGTSETMSIDEMPALIDSISGEGGIDPTWTNWAYFSYNNNRNSLVGKLKYADTSNGTTFTNMFRECTELIEIPEIDTSNGTVFTSMFYGCTNLVKIGKLNVTKARTTMQLNSIFANCTSLQEIAFEGTIGVDIKFSYSPINYESIMNVIGALAEIDGYVLTISSTTNGYLSDSDIAIATQKGWSVTVV